MMNGNSIQGMRVAALATDGFELTEYTEPRKALEQAGATVVLIAPKAGTIYAMKHHDKAGTFTVEMTLDKADPASFEAVLLPGGANNADALRMMPAAQEFVRRAQHANKPIAVICHGAWLLVSAGLVKGRRMTSWPSIADDIRNAGGLWEDREVIRDRNWISSRKPDDLPAFNREMITLFGEARRGQPVQPTGSVSAR